jgi:hypothetical protein
MLSGQMLGMLNVMVSTEKSKDPEGLVTEIHIGNIHPLFREYFVRSEKDKAPIFMTTIDGIPIYSNAKCGPTFRVIRRGESWEKKMPEPEIIIDGVKPSKTWIRNNLNFFTNKGVKQ